MIIGHLVESFESMLIGCIITIICNDDDDSYSKQVEMAKFEKFQEIEKQMSKLSLCNFVQPLISIEKNSPDSDN
ncbi:hypothetical protein DERP_001441 [Dermatophagoides pteronyssinus]|uniref:Uncharacterized protein n=1 Tax=Dermatophagoides pteronyssinus TaxID=6956 RepID=A0ABQ8JF40_DERPT|nr:hypothetical protein DERP_001441 [Dermatophagoides pteronyssinus]